MKPLSLDLRQRIINAYERGEGSQAHLAERFSVSLSTVERLLRQWRSTGSLDPQRQGGSQSRITDEERARVHAWVRAESDLTQDELAVRFTTAAGRPVSRRTMGRLRAALGHSRKKSR